MAQRQQGAAAGAQDPDPLAEVKSVDIDVDNLTIEAYLKAIESLKSRDLERAGQDAFRGIPVTSQVAGWRRINLMSTGNPTVSLLIDETDSYLVAINPGDGRGWFKYTDRKVPEALRARRMGLDSSYSELRKGLDRDELVFGLPILKHAYHTLLGFEPELSVRNPKMKKQRKVLIQMAVLFCKVIRFKLILERIVKLMTEGSTGPLDALAWEWINNWSAISKFALVCKEQEGNHVFVDAVEDLEKVFAFGIHSRDDVVALLSLILRSSH